MATSTEINAIADIILDVFESDPAKFQAALTRIALQAELDALRSQRRNLQEDADASASDYVTQLSALDQLVSAKQAEIDALAQ